MTNDHNKLNEKDQMAEFLKKAFCIDGECKYIKVAYVENNLAAFFELNDTKRGKFNVIISKLP